MGQTETWTYNGQNQVASTTDFDGNRINYLYDTLGRVTEKDEYAPGATTATKVVTYTYDMPDTNNDGGYYDTVTVSGQGTTTTHYDLYGNLVEIDSPQGTINYTYDPVTGEKTDVTTAKTHIQYAYDDFGRLAKIRVLTLDGVNFATPLQTTYGYDLNGNLVSTVSTTSTGQTLTETRTYDMLGRLASIKDTDSAQNVLFSEQFARDKTGRIVLTTENTAQSETFSYDNLGRLTQEVIASSTAQRTFHYAYDLASNRFSSFDSAASATVQYGYDANDRLVSTRNTATGTLQTYTYDNNGNTLTVTTAPSQGLSQVTTYTWDLENRLVSASVPDSNGTIHTTIYRYDDSGNRLSETTDGNETDFLNDPNQAFDQVLEEYAPGGVLAATYVRGLDLLFQDRSGTRSYYLNDDLGSTRVLTGSSGSVTDTYAFDPYGNVIAQTTTLPAPTPNEYLYAGYQYDATLGQDYARARYFDGVSGRFTSLDSSEGNSFDPLTLNRYAYAGDDPIDNFDLSGHDFTIGSITLLSAHLRRIISEFPPLG